MSTSPQALPALPAPPVGRYEREEWYRANHPENESEENVLCALWQHWNEAIRERTFSAVVVCHCTAFKQPESRIVVEALLLNDGDCAAARRDIEAKSSWQLHSLRRLVAICEKFPMSVAGARVHVARLVERIARKERAA